MRILLWPIMKILRKNILASQDFSLIERPKMEMIELIDQSFNAVVYFSYPTLANILKI